MSRDFVLTWNAKSKRWFKKQNGKQFAVSCKELEISYPKLFAEPTKEGSYRAANQWWQDRQPKQYAELDGATLLQLVEQRPDVMDEMDVATICHVADKIEAHTLEWGNDVMRRMKAADAAYHGVQPSGPTMAEATAKFLGSKEADIGPDFSVGRFDAIQRSTEYFRDWMKSETPVAAINAAKLAEYRTHLVTQIGKKALGDRYAHGHLQVAKQFIAWAYELEILASLPRNFTSKNLVIKIRTKAVVRFTIAEVNQLLEDAVDRTRLYLLMTMNCGMMQQDMSDLLHSEVDLKEGVITRKRSKTKKHDNVPTVKYRLWATTKALLQRFATKPDECSFVLLNRNGLPLVRTWLGKDKKLKKVDAVRLAYRHIKTSVADKGQRALRKTSASLLADHPQYAAVKTLFLGHSPRSVADKHYVDTPQTLLDAAVAWLGEQYGQN